jgi:hypothetical protein
LLWSGEDWTLGVLKTFPGDSKVQQELRSMKLEQEERMFREEVENTGDFADVVP